MTRLLGMTRRAREGNMPAARVAAGVVGRLSMGLALQW